MGALEPPHLILILVIVLIVFGPGKLPEIGKSLGESLREFRRATTPADDRPSPAATAVTTAPAASIACPHCGSSVAAANRFCGRCGSALSVTQASAAPHTP